MIELEDTTDKLVRHTLVNLMRKVPWGPGRDMLLQESARLRAEAGAANIKVNDIVLKEMFTFNSRGEENDGVWQDMRDRELRFRAISDESGWRSQLYALAAAGRFPRPDDLTVENFAEALVEDIRFFQENGFCYGSAPMKDVSEAVSGYLEAEGLDLADVVLPPTIEELIDSGADRPAHIDEERWNSEVAAYYRQMTLDNTPSDFINGGSDYDDGGHAYAHDDDEETSTLAMR